MGATTEWGGGPAAKIAVVAHTGGARREGLKKLRRILAEEGIKDPQCYESRDVSAIGGRADAAVGQGADLVYVWGGDGTVRGCIEALAHSRAAMAILPGGTANLLAANLGIPADLRRAVRIGLEGHRLPLDTGRVNGERFAVMAGAGFDALMMRDADASLKVRLGSAAYVLSGIKNLDAPLVTVAVAVEGRRFFEGDASCLLMGNVGRLLAGIPLFPRARPDDGTLELGVGTARGRVQWIRTVCGVAVGRSETSPFINMARGRHFDIDFAQPVPYQIDGDLRGASRSMHVEVDPSSVVVSVPRRPKEDGES